MGCMNFNSSTLEKIFKAFKWTRNNTIEIFEEGDMNNILDYKSSGFKKTSYTFQSIIFQFQCCITTTDTYYRKLAGNKNKEFGILVRDNIIIQKKDIQKDKIKNLLREQLIALENLLKKFDDKQIENNINSIQAILNHEYLHQGQLILMFREAGVDLPQKFKKAFAL